MQSAGAWDRRVKSSWQALRLKQLLLSTKWLLYAAVGVSVLIWIISTSQTFQECVHTSKNQKPYQALHERHSKLEGVSIRARLSVACTGRFIEVNQGPINTLATILVALSTLALWIATQRLWRTGQEQIAIARQEAAYTRRPHFRVRFARLAEVDGASLVMGKPVTVMLDVLNNGQADAVIQASHLEIFWSSNGLPAEFPYVRGMPLNHFASEGNDKRHVIAAGGGTQFVRVQGYRLMDERITDIKLEMSGWNLYLLGWIGYCRPDDKYNRFFDFALQFKPQTGRFLPVEHDPDYAHDPDGK